MSMIPGWMYKIYAPDDTQRDSVSGEFFKNTRLESVIREAIQNSLDARNSAKGHSCVRIYYSGNEAAVDGEAYAAEFRGSAIDPHYSHSKSGLENVPAAGEKCIFLTIEDFNTTGLTGSVTIRPTDDELESDRIKGNYYNYFFRENRSDKAGAGALGSWGAGKIMFMKASRLRTAFTLSVRDDAETPCFLAGRSVMMSHSVGNETFAPDYWFGVEKPLSNPPERYMRKQPITDAEQIAAFAKKFNLKRTQESGTSIVVPYLDVNDEDGNSQFSLENLVGAVIKNFMLAIQKGELEVLLETGKDGKVVKVSKSELPHVKKFLPLDPDAKSDLVTRAHYELAAKVLATDLPETQTIELKHVSPNIKSMWSDDIFAGQDLKAIKKLVNAEKPILFKVPMTVQEKAPDGNQKQHTDTFEVALVRSATPNSFRTAYYRAGLLIDDASRKAFSGYVSLVNIENAELAKLLVASEPPSHNQWDAGAERVKKAYFNPTSHINFVTSAVSEIISRIEQADQEPDKNVLIGPFGIPIDEDDDPKPDPIPPTSTSDDPKPPDSNPPGPEPEPPPPPPIPEEFLHFAKLQGKVGFTLSMKSDRVSEKGYPVECPFVMGYAPFTKTSWSKFDFRLEDKDKITLELDAPEQADLVDVKAEDNRLTLTVKKPGAFRLSVTGFDPNFDLEVSKKRYVYPSAKEEEK